MDITAAGTGHASFHTNSSCYTDQTQQVKSRTPRLFIVFSIYKNKSVQCTTRMITILTVQSLLDKYPQLTLLKKKQNIKLNLGCLQSILSWLFYPAGSRYREELMCSLCASLVFYWTEICSTIATEHHCQNTQRSNRYWRWLILAIASYITGKHGKAKCIFGFRGMASSKAGFIIVLCILTKKLLFLLW